MGAVGLESEGSELEQLQRRMAAADRGEQLAPPASSPDGQGVATDPAGVLVVDEAPLWIEAAKQYGQILREMVPARAKPHWTDERLGNVGAAIARAAKHYGWKYGGWATHPLAGIAVAAVPLAWPIAEPYVRPWFEKAVTPAPAAEASPPPPAEVPPPAPRPSGPARVAPIG